MSCIYYDGCVPTCEFPSGYEDCEDMDFVGFGCWCNYGYVFDDNGNCIALEDCEEIIYGCTDPNACNYNPEVTSDDGSCIYPEENYDCDGNCIVEIDCAGICGGYFEIIGLGGNCSCCGDPYIDCMPPACACGGEIDGSDCNYNDSDGDGVIDEDDSDDNNPYVCMDSDNDTCDDCSSGQFDPSNDGYDYDGDGLCDAGDDDDDSDGVHDSDDPCPLDSFCCGDTDMDTCDDCVMGYYSLDMDVLIEYEGGVVCNFPNQEELGVCWSLVYNDCACALYDCCCCGWCLCECEVWDLLDDIGLYSEGDCVGACTEAYDCAGTWGGSAVIDECGVCAGDNTGCAGCTDPEACNYDETATIDDGNCLFGWEECDEYYCPGYYVLDFLNDDCYCCADPYADCVQCGICYDMEGNKNSDYCYYNDSDSDGDGVIDSEDSDPNNPYQCSDIDADTCDDCSSGTFDPSNDGFDDNGDGICNAGECGGDNPAGCFGNGIGCQENYICIDDGINCESGGCSCDGGWLCTDDCGGGTCYPAGCLYGSGDINCDGVLNVIDLLQIVYYILDPYNYSFDSYQIGIADSNYDGIVDILDIVNFIDMILDGGVN